MENNITIQDRLYITAMHTGPIMICEPGIEPVPHHIVEGVDYELEQVIAERTNYNPEWIVLLKKPLDKISDDDAIKVGDILHSLLNYPGFDRIQRVKNILKNLDTFPSATNGEQWLQAFDYLRVRNYAVRWGPYSVQELIDAGIYKIVVKK